MDGIPIIKLELTGMKSVVRTALMQHVAQLDTAVQEALEAACSEDSIRQVVSREVGRELEAVLTSEIDAFFRYGDGRAAVQEVVQEQLNKLLVKHA